MSEPRHYRPAWFLRLFVRLEDFGAADNSTSQTTDVPFDTKAKEIDAQIDKNETAIAQEEVAVVLGTSRNKGKAARLRADTAKLEKKKAKLTEGSAVDKAGPGDEWSVQFVTVPAEMEIEDRGFREAAQLTATFPFDDMPLDPRIIRECRVEGYLGTVSSADFGTPDNWHLKPIPAKNCIRRFNGYVDMPEMEHNDSTATIHIKARSYESVLIDGKINPHAPAYRIEGESEYLTTYVNRILSQYPPTSGDAGGDPFQAVWFAADPASEPKLGRKDLLRSLQTAKSRNQAAGAQPGQDPPVQSESPAAQVDPDGTGDSAQGGQASMPPKSVTPDGMSIWDLITQACELCGCIPIYQPALQSGYGLDEDVDRPTGSQNGGKKIIVFGGAIDTANYLLLTPPQAFLDDITDAHIRVKGGSRDRFSREFSDESGRWTSDVRFMVWGHNIKSMKLSRKMGRTRPTAVEVRAYNPDADATLRVMKARFPSTKADIDSAALAGKAKGKARKQTAKGGGKVDIVRTFVLQGVRTQRQLKDAAVAIYHQLTRAELSIELETDDLSSYMDPDASLRSQALVKCENDDPDIMRLAAGSPVRVVVARKTADNLVISSLSDFYGSKGGNVREMIAKQRERWGNWLSSDGQENIDAIDQMAERIQRAYDAAKLPDIFYVRSIKTHCSAEEGEGFKATMELVNYMPDNDPASMSAEDRETNDRRKLKAAKRGKKNIRTVASEKKTQELTDKAQLDAQKGRP